MASEIVDNNSIQDRIDDLAHKAIGILQMMRHVDTSNPLPIVAMSGSAWAVEEMVQEIQELATKKGA